MGGDVTTCQCRAGLRVSLLAVLLYGSGRLSSEAAKPALPGRSIVQESKAAWLYRSARQHDSDSFGPPGAPGPAAA